MAMMDMYNMGLGLATAPTQGMVQALELENMKQNMGLRGAQTQMIMRNLADEQRKRDLSIQAFGTPGAPLSSSTTPQAGMGAGLGSPTGMSTAMPTPTAGAGLATGPGMAPTGKIPQEKIDQMEEAARKYFASGFTEQGLAFSKTAETWRTTNEKIDENIQKITKSKIDQVLKAVVPEWHRIVNEQDEEGRQTLLGTLKSGPAANEEFTKMVEGAKLHDKGEATVPITMDDEHREKLMGAAATPLVRAALEQAKNGQKLEIKTKNNKIVDVKEAKETETELESRYILGTMKEEEKTRYEAKHKIGEAAKEDERDLIKRDLKKKLGRNPEAGEILDEEARRAGQKAATVEKIKAETPLDPSTQKGVNEIAKSISDLRVGPTKAFQNMVQRFGGANSGRIRTEVTKAVEDRYPNFDWTKADIYQASQSNQSFIRAEGNVNSVIESAELAKKYVSALKNNNIQLANRIANEWAVQTGNPAPTNAKVMAVAMAQEFNRAYSDSIVNPEGRFNKELANLNVMGGSPSQLLGALDTNLELTKIRKKAIGRMRTGNLSKEEILGTAETGASEKGKASSLVWHFKDGKWVQE